jgi:hypothetical protein
MVTQLYTFLFLTRTFSPYLVLSVTETDGTTLCPVSSSRSNLCSIMDRMVLPSIRAKF